ncbi:MAG: MBOAT family O-acyltransferase [Candidatus Brocadiia bacterium]
MLFHTWVFAAFFLVFYPVYLAVKGTRLRDYWLLLSSYVFYGWWNPLYLLLISYSTVVDYFVVLRMVKSPHRKRWLALAVTNNLCLLATFKYAGFLTENLNALLAALGGQYVIPVPNWLLPVGISFYTFQSMSYTIDCYRGRIQPEPRFVRFATFVSLFPQLVAGPIQRASNLLPQLQQEQKVTRADVTDGLSLFLVGLFKKVALADYLALYVDKVYGAPAQYQGPALLLATAAFGWQIYFDFSGYTDMARGIARMMGYKLMLNFNHPYLATGLGDFWSRWHISLSSWFKDYVYIPMGGNREGTLKTYRNMCLTMLISGVWHGATWMFVIWGALHALGRVLTRELEGTAFWMERVPKFVKQMLVYGFVTFAWIFFRARSMGDAKVIISRIFNPQWVDPSFPLLAAMLVLMVWLYQYLYESRARWALQLAPVQTGMAACMVLYLATMVGSSDRPFIYFQF